MSTLTLGSTQRFLFKRGMLVLIVTLLTSLIGVALPIQAAATITNPGFESGIGQNPTGWLEWSAGGHLDASFSEGCGGAGCPHTGSGAGAQWKNSAYDVYTYQSLTGLTNGTYTMRAWVRGSGGQTTARMEVKNYGGALVSTSIGHLTSWTQISINNINVTNGTAMVGFYSQANAGQYINFDDVEFFMSGGGSWHLVWSDEFNGTSIDTSKWGYEIGLIRNNEAQYYTNRSANSYISGGNLVIKAIRENYMGAAYTSASLNTKGKASWTYGKFEMRGRIPTALGTWPAWWGLGTNIDTVGWPASGEIDMMEFYRSTALYNVMNGAQQWFSYTEPFTDSTNYHTWVMEWNSASNIKLYRDGVLKLTYTGGHVAFTRPFYMLANLAIGGNSGGDPSGTAFPQYYYIDYIRVSQWW